MLGKNLRIGLGLLAGVAAASTLGFAASRPGRVQQEKQPTARAAKPAKDWMAQAAAAREEIDRQPQEIAGYHHLAISLMKGQRETGDPELYGRSEQALRQAQRLAPEDYTTRKLLAWVLAGEHRFEEALVIARECTRLNPDDSWNYGVIGDALTELGDYPAAVEAVQKMVDLRPGSVSYARAAHQRRLHGDPAGALGLYDLALEATGAGDREGRAWLLCQKAEIHFLSGKLEKAEADYRAALREVPQYYFASAGQAQLLAARGRLIDAAARWEDVLSRLDRPDWRASLGDVYLAMGRREEAEAAYRAVEEHLEQRFDDPVADARHQLAQFLADRGRSPEKALALAREEAAGARDIYAADTLAWALYQNGRYPEAWQAADQALCLGTQDPKLLYHAGAIAVRLPERRRQGIKLLRRALAKNPAWAVLDGPAARNLLREMERS